MNMRHESRTIQFWTARQLAERWQRDVRWVWDQAALGKVPGIKIGGQWRFDPQDIEDYELGRKTGYQIELATRAQQRKQTR